MTENYSDQLIQAYVPESDYLNHFAAMKLAVERDEQAAQNLEQDAQEQSDESPLRRA